MFLVGRSIRVCFMCWICSTVFAPVFMKTCAIEEDMSLRNRIACLFSLALDTPSCENIQYGSQLLEMAASSQCKRRPVISNLSPTTVMQNQYYVVSMYDTRDELPFLLSILIQATHCNSPATFYGGKAHVRKHKHKKKSDHLPNVMTLEAGITLARCAVLPCSS